MIARSLAGAVLLSGSLLLLGACLEADRRVASSDTRDAIADSSPPVDTAGDSATVDSGVPSDTAAPMDTTSADTEDAADTSGECGPGRPCPEVPGACRVARCMSGACVEGDAADDTVCEDDNPCTGAGRCRKGKCEEGDALADDTRCDDDEVCNGSERCSDGKCSVTVAFTCPASSDPCRSWACQETAGGCAEVLADDHLPCGGDDNNVTSRECSAGRCVPLGMVYVPAGPFTMGCDDLLCGSNARPSHTVTLSGFAIDRREVDNTTYAACVAAQDEMGSGCPARDLTGLPSAATDPDAAASRLTWSQADAVCTHLGKRLCTEAEWEKAARGDDARVYPWGDAPDPSCERVVMWDAQVSAKRGCGLGGPDEPGSRPDGDSPYGASDMAGNVAEWVADYYNPDVYAARAALPEAVTDPVQSQPTAQHPVTRILRGGSWRNESKLQLRATRRRAEIFTIFDDDTGTRCCLTPDGGGGVVTPGEAGGS